jgi:hypothetical protein
VIRFTLVTLDDSIDRESLVTDSLSMHAAKGTPDDIELEART